MTDKKFLGIAIAGLGEYAETQILPALKQTKNCRLSAIITDDEKDKNELAEKHDLKLSQIYYYNEIDRLKENDDVDVVYIIVPNKMHKEYCEQAANCGKHVLCEKPMAVSIKDCEDMIEVCKKNNVRLFIGYRLHFDPYHQAFINICREKKYGNITSVSSSNGFHLTEKNDWRLNKHVAGGGSMMDMGIYIVNEFRQLFRQNPVSVSAQKKMHRPGMFCEVEESIEWEMHYPGNITAKGFCSYFIDISELVINCEYADLLMTNAYKYEHITAIVNNEHLSIDENDHKAELLNHMAECINNNKISMIEAEEGLQDLQVIDAIYRSIESGKKEML